MIRVFCCLKIIIPCSLTQDKRYFVLFRIICHVNIRITGSFACGYDALLFFRKTVFLCIKLSCLDKMIAITHYYSATNQQQCRRNNETEKKMHYLMNFFKCGLFGWGLECFWTGCHSLFYETPKKLTCTTSIWMFPIYGLAVFIEPIYHLIKKKSTLFRGFIYTLCIFLVEYSTGTFLKKKNRCPWNYSDKKVNIKGIIRLDFAPLWFIVGLLFERLVRGPAKKRVR